MYVNAGYSKFKCDFRKNWNHDWTNKWGKALFYSTLLGTPRKWWCHLWTALLLEIHSHNNLYSQLAVVHLRQESSRPPNTAASTFDDCVKKMWSVHSNLILLWPSQQARKAVVESVVLFFPTPLYSLSIKTFHKCVNCIQMWWALSLCFTRRRHSLPYNCLKQFLLNDLPRIAPSFSIKIAASFK